MLLIGKQRLQKKKKKLAHLLKAEKFKKYIVFMMKKAKVIVLTSQIGYRDET